MLLDITIDKYTKLLVKKSKSPKFYIFFMIVK